MKQLPIGDGITISDYELKSNKPNIVTTSHNEKVDALYRNIQYYSGKITLFARHKTAKRKLEAFLESLDGQQETFELFIPDINNSLQHVSGVPALRAEYPAGTSRISFDGYGGRISAGDYFRLSNDNKLYRALEDATSNQSVAISPSLRKTHRARDKGLFSGFGLVVRLEQNNFTVTAEKGNTQVMRVTLKWKEAL